MVAPLERTRAELEEQRDTTTTDGPPALSLISPAIDLIGSPPLSPAAKRIENCGKVVGEKVRAREKFPSFSKGSLLFYDDFYTR